MLGSLCVSLQAAPLNALCLALRLFSPSSNKVQAQHRPKRVSTLKMSSVRPCALGLSSLFTPTIVASDFCAAAIGQETTVSSDCASSRLETSWAELYCHIITP